MTAPTLVWIRKDLRLSDHAALTRAAGQGPVIPVVILDELTQAMGAAPRWRFGLGVAAFARALAEMGSALVLRRGAPAQVLADLAHETGARCVLWQRAYDPDQIARDTAVKSALSDAGLEAQSLPGHLMFEPWSVETGTGGYYRVYTPFWKSVRQREVSAPLPAPARLPAPEHWPESESLDSWALGAGMNRGADIVAPHLTVGEAAAQDRLARFIDGPVDAYDSARDLPAVNGTSGLSENLAWGEISPRQCWQAGQAALERGSAGAETFLKELVWREFAYHLAYHTPHLLTGNWKPDWDAFPWNTDADHPQVQAWRQGRTGIPFVDAAMREMYVTGRMHNRGRMIVASYLTKHLLTHWRIGMDWFAECLVDWDPASNALGWQWSAGSGPDATPYFRVFNPDTQLKKFDTKGNYARRWIAEAQRSPHRDALSYFDAIPRAWGLRADAPYPAPIVTPADGRARALSAYENRSF